jgi:hypothetical protein
MLIFTSRNVNLSAISGPTSKYVTVFLWRSCCDGVICYVRWTVRIFRLELRKLGE